LLTFEAVAREVRFQASPTVTDSKSSRLSGATAAGLASGRGVARCVVGAQGLLAGRVADPGAPDDLGFSDAAARLASGRRMSLWSADAAPVAGALVRVPIRRDHSGSAG
jgi:hypothetical protein